MKESITVWTKNNQQQEKSLLKERLKEQQDNKAANRQKLSTRINREPETVASSSQTSHVFAVLTTSVIQGNHC
jgi:hypothetical protein